MILFFQFFLTHWCWNSTLLLFEKLSSGGETTRQTCTLGTQHKSSQLRHFIDGVGSLGCMNLTITSKFSVETSTIIPTQYCLSHTNIQQTEKEKVNPLAQVNEQYWSQTEWHSTDYLKHIFAPTIKSDTGMNWWKDLVSETVSALLYLSSIFTLMLPISWFFKNKKSIPFISSTQNSNILSAVKIWLLIGRCRLALVTSCFTVFPAPSHVDFPWLVAKTFHSHFTPSSKSLLWRHKFKEFLQFLYWPAQPSEK